MPGVWLWWGTWSCKLRSCLFFQTFIFTDGEDEALTKLTGVDLILSNFFP